MQHSPIILAPDFFRPSIIELDVMLAIWRNEEAGATDTTAREIHAELARDQNISYFHVNKILSKLRGESWIKQTGKSGKRFVYRSLISRRQVGEQFLLWVRNEFFDGHAQRHEAAGPASLATPITLDKSETQVMLAVWKLEESSHKQVTIRDVISAEFPDKKYFYVSIMTVFRRLNRKGWLRQTGASERSYMYESTRSRHEVGHTFERWVNERFLDVV